MDYLGELLREVSLIRGSFGVEPERAIPSSVEVVDAPAEIHARCPLTDDGKLLLSSQLLNYAEYLIKKESFSLFIPKEADSVPQVHDIAWAYSGAPRNIWDSIRERPPRPFLNYDPALLFSLIPLESRLRVIEETLLYVRASAKRGQLTLESYLYLLRSFLGAELRLTEVDRKVIEVLSHNPYAKAKVIRSEAGVSEASISRSVRKLKEAGYLFGPENVRLWKINLVTLIASFPNERKYREAFWRFPFTYNQLIPTSREGRVHAYLLIPPASIRDLERLKKVGVEIGIVRRNVQRFNLTPPREPMAAMVRAYLSSGVSELKQSFQPEPPPIKLYRKDIAVLNEVLREGRVTSASLTRTGLRSAKQRLSRLRSAGIIGNYYMVSLPLGFEVTLFRLSCPCSEAERLASTLASVTTATVSCVEGKTSYCLALAFTPRELKSDLIRGIRAIYGDEVELALDIMELSPLWLLPEELWDERRQTFKWEEPLEELISGLKGA